MKRLEHQIEELQRSRFEIDLEATINDLFLGYPTLCGFSIRDVANLPQEGEACQIDGELFLADVGVYPSCGSRVLEALYGEVANALLALVEEHPEAHELVRGRTFTRALH